MLPLINLILSLFFIFFYFLYPAGDADLGWHYQYGQAFFKTHQILKANTFAYTMPEYVWPNHSWGYDLFLYQLFHHFSFLGLTISASLLITLTFFISVYGYHRFPGLSLTTILFAYFGQFLLNTGLRSQLVSLLFLALLWRLLTLPPKKYLFFLFPFLFFLWANLHGQFIIGLGLILMYFLAYIWHKPQNHLRQKYYLYLFLLSLVATFLNPFGFKLHLVAVEHLAAPTLSNIFEWMPWELNTTRMLFLLAYSLLFWWVYFKTSVKKEKPLGFTPNLVIINLLSLKARRMIPVFVLYSAPIFTKELFKRLFPRYLKSKFVFILEAGLLTFMIWFTLTQALPPRKISNQSWHSYCHITQCSPGVINFITHNGLQGKVFNTYSLGGFLIQNTPKLQPFIDGRMVAWHQGSWYPFNDYNTMIHNLPGAQALFEKSKFDYALVHNVSEITPVLEQVVRWPIIYRDEIVTLFARPFLL